LVAGEGLGFAEASGRDRMFAPGQIDASNLRAVTSGAAPVKRPVLNPSAPAKG